MKQSIHQTFGEMIREWRKQRGEPLRVVAAAIEIDSTLLSKLERGERLPTTAQVAKFSDYFEIPLEELTAQVIAEKIVAEYGPHTATLQAVDIVKERAAAYQTERP